ncbi:MAG: hypothetical protein B6I22_08810 [Desulfobacteraceae bacterium 4572_123]|nr:MAG: hypothetical protein B6I22_08810 [Desulfobacteraceae bacterium 4572_123]
MLDWAFAMGSWYLERWWGFGNIVGNEGLYGMNGTRTKQILQPEIVFRREKHGCFQTRGR